MLHDNESVEEKLPKGKGELTVASAVVAERVTAGQAALMLGCSSNYVRVLVDTGRLPAERGPLGVRLIDKSAVEEMARTRRRNGRNRSPR